MNEHEKEVTTMSRRNLLMGAGIAAAALAMPRFA